MISEKFEKVSTLIQEGAQDGMFPGAVILVAKEGEIVFFRSFGYRTLLPESQPMEEDTIFDLASLTKPLATTLAVMKLVDQGTVQLDQPAGDILPAPLKDKSSLTLRLLLSHSAGFAEWRPFYRDLMNYKPEDRKPMMREWLVEEPLAYRPGSMSLYSDLGFMFIEWVVEEASGVPMHRLLEKEIYAPMGVERTFMAAGSRLRAFQREEFAATEDCAWRKEVIQGKVHDENAFALGGYSGHAGLFGTGAGVHAIVDMLREHEKGNRKDLFRPEVVREFFSPQHAAPESTWALGWDTPSRGNSSSGSRFSRRSVGHLGFTGTSVWLDLDRGVVVILLTNRIHPSRENERIKLFRPKLHNTVMEELGYH